MTISPERREVLHRHIKIIVAFTITYNLIEAVVALLAGSIADSSALIAFGLDSTIEVSSALAVAWQFTRKEPEIWEKVTVRLVAIAFFALALYVVVKSIMTLIGAAEPEHSPLGIGIAIASLVIMPALAWWEYRTGKELGSSSVMADSKQLLLCIYLSAIVLVGLVLNSILGWSWADPVAALVVAGLAVKEGVEAWEKGEVESPFEVLEDLD